MGPNGAADQPHPALGAGLAPTVGRGAGCRRGWAARHATPDCGWEAAAPLRGRESLPCLLPPFRSRARARSPKLPACRARATARITCERAPISKRPLVRCIRLFGSAPLPQELAHAIALVRHLEHFALEVSLLKQLPLDQLSHGRTPAGLSAWIHGLGQHVSPVGVDSETAHR